MTSKIRNKGRKKRKDVTTTLDVTATFRVNKLFLDKVKQRANKLGMNLSTYIIAILIYDLRFSDATDHVKQLQKNQSIVHLFYPFIDKELDQRIIKYWRGKQKNILAGIDQGELKFEDMDTEKGAPPN